MRLEQIIKRAQNLIDKYESLEALPCILKVDDLDKVPEDFNGLVLVVNRTKFVKKNN